MSDGQVRVSLVVPVHHGKGTLEPLFSGLDRFLSKALVSTQVVLVDDHGRHPTSSTDLQQFASARPEVTLLRNDRNRGKGYSVARGMLAASGEFRVFTDADLAYPLEQVWKVVSALERGADVAIACRVHPESQYTMNALYLRYLFTRHLASRAFNKVVRLTLIPNVLDTQAGLKGYTAVAARDVFSRVNIAGFGFDLESLFVAKRLGLRIEQIPVRYHYNDEPTTVRLIRDARTMAADLARIRWRAWTGEYEAVPRMTPSRVDMPFGATTPRSGQGLNAAVHSEVTPS